MFHVNPVFAGIEHIQDAMGVCMTLIEGEREAFLIDAGYGTEDVRDFIHTRTDRPVRVILTHGHHDHVLGARWFPEAWMDPADRDEFALRTAAEQRERVAAQAREKHLEIPPDYLTAPIPLPLALPWSGSLDGIPVSETDPGGRKVVLLRVPGHTRGSVMVYLPDDHLLLTGDDWNPCTWLWFPCSIAVQQWKRNMLSAIRAIGQHYGRIEHVLCSHQPMLRTGEELEEYLQEITEEKLSAAPDAEMGSGIHTARLTLSGNGQELVFDRDKFLQAN